MLKAMEPQNILYENKTNEFVIVTLVRFVVHIFNFFLKKLMLLHKLST